MRAHLTLHLLARCDSTMFFCVPILPRTCLPAVSLRIAHARQSYLIYFCTRMSRSFCAQQDFVYALGFCLFEHTVSQFQLVC